MKTTTQFLSYLTQFFLEIFQIKVVEEIKAHILSSVNFFFSKIVPFER